MESTGWIIIIICAIVVAFAIKSIIDKKNLNKQLPDLDNTSNEELIKWYLNLGSNSVFLNPDFIHKLENKLYPKTYAFGKYLSGHPDISSAYENIYLSVEDNKLKIAFRQEKDKLIQKELGYIDCDKIKNIAVEDASTIEKRVTFSRILLVGIFALAWKKKKVNEIGFIVIEWNDGRFDHETTFQFEGVNAMQSANSGRNWIIKSLK
jgi:hypothetical protein